MDAIRLDTRQRRTLERTVLYQVLADNLETFLDRVAKDDFRTLPRFVERAPRRARRQLARRRAAWGDRSEFSTIQSGP